MAGFKGASTAAPRTGSGAQGASEGKNGSAGIKFGSHSGGQGGR